MQPPGVAYNAGILTSSPNVALSPPSHPATAILRWSIAGLAAASWISAAAFALYILAFYVAAIPARLDSWNQNLPGLYQKGNTAALSAMAVHLAAGGVILLLGPIQLIAVVRRRWPAIHRWFGRIYVLTGALAGIGGLGFILCKGAIGGAPMNCGFALYGLLVTVAAVQTWRHARARRFARHRAWAIRLFALAIGSWLYRMDYGFWFIAAHGLGHTHTFRGPFDIVMSFFFYLPNLAIAELFLRAGPAAPHPALRLSLSALLNAATLLVAVGTYYFVRFYWGPAILHIAGLLL